MERINNFGGKSILVVEDNIVNQKLIDVYLKAFGIQVTIVNNGFEALNECKINVFDMILMDTQLPLMNGIQATRELSKIEKFNAPIIAITAGTTDKDRQECKEAGTKDFLAKPFNLKSLTELLSKWL